MRTTARVDVEQFDPREVVGLKDWFRHLTFYLDGLLVTGGAGCKGSDGEVLQGGHAWVEKQDIYDQRPFTAGTEW